MFRLQASTIRIPKPQVMEQPKMTFCVFFHVLTARATQSCESTERPAWSEPSSWYLRFRDMWLGRTVATAMWLQRGGTYAWFWQMMLAGPHHTTVWPDYWFTEKYFILWLRKLDLGPKQSGMLSADFEELGGSLSADVAPSLSSSGFRWEAKCCCTHFVLFWQ